MSSFAYVQFTVKRVNVFSLLQDFCLNYQLTLHVCGSVCTDVPPAILGKTSNFAAYIQKGVAICIIYCHALGRKGVCKNEGCALDIIYTYIYMYIYIYICIYHQEIKTKSLLLS